jgi:superfamily I DNA/RNA helicase/RecB family exonuclease
MVSPDLPRRFHPDREQARVLALERGAMLVSGSAGTGKSAVLLERFARLIEGGADPERIGLVVRTKRGRVAARGALLRRLGSSLPGLRVVTTQGLAHLVLGARFAAIDHDRPPEVLTAADQFAKVRELLEGELREDWPAYGAMLGMRGFADQIRQFLSRAQEALIPPDEIERKAVATGLTGWLELARFYRRYLNVLDDEALVDFAGLVGQAAAAASGGEPLFDHLLVDDYQDATFAAERLLLELAPRSLVVAADPDAHVFSFQGTTDVPARRFTTVFHGADHVALAEPHRASHRELAAWLAPHASEEHSAIAREIRRVHVEDGVPWAAIALVVRRQGAELAAMLRAMDDARVPRVVPERGATMLGETVTAPFVLALRWLARPEERDGLVESVLTSHLGGLSPAAARGLARATKAADLAPAAALSLDAGLSDAERASVAVLREVLEDAAAVADRSAQDAFRILWHGLPYARALVDAAGVAGPGDPRPLDAVVALSDAIARASEIGSASVAAFVDALEAGEAGPGLSAWAGVGPPDAVPVYTAHDAAGEEFDTVIVAGAIEGNFPSLSRPEPMFDLTVLDRPVPQSERNRRRLEDERRLFRLVVGRARRRVLFTAGDPHADAPATATRSRFVAELGVAWMPGPPAPAEPLTVREAASTWRRRLADPAVAAPSRLAALDGILALGIDPTRWWFQRDWTRAEPPADPGALRVSYSRLDKLENCSLQYVLGQEIGLEGDAGYHAWVGHLVHRLIEECEDGLVPRSADALVAEAERRWQAERFPSFAVSEAFRDLVTKAILPAWFREYGEAPPALAREARFSFPFDGAQIAGMIDRIGPCEGGGTQITDYKTGKARNAADPGENLQLGIYYLAVNETPDLQAYRPVRAVQLAFLRDVDRSGQIAHSTQAFLGDEAAYRAGIEERLRTLLDRLRSLRERGVYPPNAAANCRFCDFKQLCPMWPEGRELFPVSASVGGRAPVEVAVRP